MKKKKVLSILFIISTLICSACNKTDVTSTESSTNTSSENYVDTFLREVENNNVIDAKNVYKENINGISYLEEETKNSLKERLSSVISDYNSDQISDTKALEYFSTISSLNILRDSEIKPLRDDLTKLIGSKVAFSSAEKFYQDGDYYNAYMQYSLVIADDTNYSIAVSQASSSTSLYVSEIISEADAFEEEKDYVSAIKSTRDAQKLLPNNQTLIEKEATLEGNYLTYALSFASETHQNGNNYEDAIKIIDTALTILDDPALTEAKEYYKSFRPVNLFSVEKTLSYKNDYMTESSLGPDEKDRYGNTYNNGLVENALGVNGELDYKYPIGGKYNQLTGVITPGDEYEISENDSAIESYNAEIKIYADELLIYEGYVNCNSEPQSIDLDISGVETLEVQVLMNARHGGYQDTRDIEVYLADFTLRKLL